LPLNGFLLIEEPPGAAELNLSGDCAVLKISNGGGEDIIVSGIEIVDDRF